MQQSGVADGNAMRVAAEVRIDGGCVAEGTLAIYQPWLGVELAEQAFECLWVSEFGTSAAQPELLVLVKRSEPCEELSTEQRAEHAYWKQEAAPCSDPALHI